MSDLITTQLVTLDAQLGATKEEVIRSLAANVAAAGRSTSADGLSADVLEREAKAATGLPGGIAIPHCRSTHMTTGSLAFARLRPAVDFGDKEGPADLVFLIAAAEGEGQAHLKLLSKLARALVRKDFVASLRAAQTEQEVVDLVDGVINPPARTAPAAAAAATGAAAAGAAVAAGSATVPAAATEVPAAGPRRLVAVTACPTGIAHTYMAADSLEQAAKEMGYDLQVETQGSSSFTPLPQEYIDSADAVIFATDVGVRDRDRFAGKPGTESGVKAGISDPRGLITKALAAADDPRGHRIAGGGGGEKSAGDTGNLNWGKRIQQALMTGVSYMIPFVAAGGLLIALGFLLGGYQIALGTTAKDILANNSLSNLPAGGLMTYLGVVLFTIGASAFGFLVPALSGYIAYALAGRPGIAPGFVGGAIAVALNAGFIGGLVTGLVAGLVAMWIGSYKAPRWLAGLMPVVIIPLLTTLVTGLLMYLLLGRPLAALMTALQNWLTGMSSGGAIVLGIILGLMMCFDLGGPVNKSAYLFATAGLSSGTTASLMIMAAVMATGMVPPLAMALATTVRPKLFTEPELENGRAAWLLGASFISEGAIPFAAADPLRVIPSMMAGGALTGALSMAFHVTLRAPHGGIFVFFAINPIWGFLVALVAGMVLSAMIVIVLKSMTRRSAVETDAAVPVTA
ncbi:PTS system D-fructose-specific IIA component (F1P-forming), Frc family /PTS system D-fructose-specific IIB component (F1P-forming), Frc family /PTS system D-fructose-specific IIC component (F1P-forming), Frc family [Raineyella antarctica]|uniref:PTS system D-fructose-specific IIA component (F1P-forming), Frc family /PTS system D-fructose-specific IIB component (F1P-forming), Frc family /PTS system D-fructose-specific IIC component (F1P-for... n=1 Tax=Raineyella antarctica TaxID=1577474 RepID=A0A1G6GGL4_9ACTN|nr:fructose-specific PTS transporter subunit EIIC [Raineyella antarctica]SDB81094.1 PTS system D-fructose-specific IIA component (F1P-forming), Frc family /PTS system D-fructose-specific IIB component (F1P-forming), Frc family /PTS system D-fructose-specific IIC component (F1P-forming), Frc family [Raineyella antarctica]